MYVFKLLLVALLLAWLAQSNHLPWFSFQEFFFSPGQGWVMLFLLGNFSGQIQRWRYLLRMQEIHLPLGTMTRLFFIGQFFFITSIGSIAGEAARGYYVLKHSGTARMAGLSTVVMDRVLGLFTYLLTGGVFFLFWLRWGEPSGVLFQYGMTILMVTVGMVVTFALVCSPLVQGMLCSVLPVRWRSLLQQILVAYHPAHKGIYVACGISLVTSLTHFLAFMTTSRVLGIGLGWQDLLIAMPLVILSGLLPMPLGGLGVGETAAQLLLTPLGIHNGAMMMLSLRFAHWILLLPPGLYCYLTEKGPRVTMEKHTLTTGDGI